MTISEDRPITTFDEDRLGYGPFCRTAAKGLAHHGTSGSLVVGLHAPWGMGKTSAVNLMKIALAEVEAQLAPESRTIVVDFNPWLFSGRDDLLQRFFEQVAAALPDDLRETVTKYRRKLKRTVNRYGEHIGTAADIAGTGGAGTVAGKIVSLFMGNAATLEATRNDLIDKLCRSGRRLLIIIDDIDRLLPHEMREMLVLLRSTGDLPGVAYLVVCDRNIIEQGLDQAGVEKSKDSSGPTFLEKIIQVDLHVPEPQRRGLDLMFEEGVNEIMGNAIGLDSKRMSRLYQEGLKHYLNSPRRVVRLLNALRVSWPAVANEVNGPDYIVLETLRVLEREVYAAIRESKDDLVGWTPRTAEDRKKWRQEFLGRVTANKPGGPLSTLVVGLFPDLKERAGWNDDGKPERLDRKLNDEEFWDAYFRLAPNADLGSASFGREVLANLDDQAAIEAGIETALAKRDSKGRTLAGALLDDIDSHVRTKRTATAPLIRALLAKTEKLIAAVDGRGKFTDMQRDNAMVLRWIFESALEAMESPAREALLREVYAQDAASMFLAEEWWRLAGIAGAIEDGARRGDGPNISVELINELSATVKGRLDSAALDGRLKNATHPSWILGIWQHLSGEERVAAWLTGSLQDPQYVVRLCDGLMGTSYSNAGIRRFLSMDGQNKSPYTDRVYDAAKAIARETLTAGQTSLVDTFISSYETGGEKI